MTHHARLRCFAAAFALAGFAASVPASADTTILNVSYDPTRELYKAIDAAFAADWKAKTGETVVIQQSHGGSGAQARAVIDGLAADVVTLALEADIDAIAEEPEDRRRLADAAAQQLHALHLDDRLPRPQGQSQGHQGLGRPGQAGRRGDHAQPEDLGRRALELSRRLGLCRPEVRPRRAEDAGLHRARSISNVPVLDSGARGATTTFAQRGIGDVLISWENEAYLAAQGTRPGRVRDRRAVDLDQGRAAGRRWSTAMSTRRAPARSPRPISSSSTATPRRRSSPPTSTARPIPRPPIREDLKRFGDIKLATIDDPDLRRLEEGAARPTSPMAASSTRSTSRRTDRGFANR